MVRSGSGGRVVPTRVAEGRDCPCPLNERLATYTYVVRANGEWVDELYPSHKGHVAPAIGGARLLTQPADLSQAVSHCLRRSQHGRGELVHLGCVNRGSIGHLARAPARRRETAQLPAERNHCWQ